MEIISVVLIALSGLTLSIALGRLLFNWSYDVITVTTAIVMFGVGGMSLIVFTKLGMNGVIMTIALPVILTFAFIQSNFKVNENNSEYSNNIGYIYWLIMIIIFTVAGLNSWSISEYISKEFSLGIDFNKSVQYLIYVVSLFIVDGILSISMFMYELQKFSKRNS
jgi:hypothetical protein